MNLSCITSQWPQQLTTENSFQWPWPITQEDLRVGGEWSLVLICVDTHSSKIYPDYQGFGGLSCIPKSKSRNNIQHKHTCIYQQQLNLKRWWNSACVQISNFFFFVVFLPCHATLFCFELSFRINIWAPYSHKSFLAPYPFSSYRLVKYSKEQFGPQCRSVTHSFTHPHRSR